MGQDTDAIVMGHDGKTIAKNHLTTGAARADAATARQQRIRVEVEADTPAQAGSIPDGR